MKTVSHFRVASRNPVADNIYRLDLVLSNGNIPAIPEPGQFVMVSPVTSTSVLPRPFSVYQASHERFSIVFKIVGDNTRALAFGDINRQLIVTGPCGQPAKINDQAKTFILVSGGCGLASLHYLASEIRNSTKADIILAAGFPTAQQVFGQNDFEKNLEVEMNIATDDGSRGTKGTAFDVFREIIFGEENLPSPDDIQVFTCGPSAMMKAVAKLCQQEAIFCNVFLEEMMGCGLGSCKGCAIQTTSGVKHICKDGPVFDAMEILSYVQTESS